MFKILLFLYGLIAVSVGVVFAEPVYFRAVPEKILVNEGVPIKLKLEYNITDAPDKRFLVRPVISGGSISVFKKESGEWVVGNDNWSLLPKLDKELDIKAGYLSQPEIDLYFIIQDSLTSKVYRTPDVHFWTNVAYENYLQKLNDHVTSYGRILVE